MELKGTKTEKNLFERFHTPMSKKIMTALYPAENDVTAFFTVSMALRSLRYSR